jgi:hypothetical protein
MLFFGLFTVVVLPIFLIYAAGSLKKNANFRDNPATGFIRFIMYLFAGMSILSAMIILGRILRLF